MKRLLLITAILLSGCNLTENAARDAEGAIKNSDFKLYKLAVRGRVLPGIATDERGSAAALCGTRTLKGTGDVLRSDKDRKERRQRVEYATEYNRIVYEACQQNRRNAP